MIVFYFLLITVAFASSSEVCSCESVISDSPPNYFVPCELSWHAIRPGNKFYSKYPVARVSYIYKEIDGFNCYTDDSAVLIKYGAVFGALVPENVEYYCETKISPSWFIFPRTVDTSKATKSQSDGSLIASTKILITPMGQEMTFLEANITSPTAPWPATVGITEFKSIPPSNTECTVFYTASPGEYGGVDYLEVFTLSAWVVECGDVFKNSSNKIPDSEPYFCAGLEILNKERPYGALANEINGRCVNDKYVRESPFPSGTWDFLPWEARSFERWPMMCQNLGNELGRKESDDGLGFVGFVKFREMIDENPYVVVEQFDISQIQG